MSFSRETSAGYFTGEEGGQRNRHGPTASHATQLRVCPECGCYLEAVSQEIMDLKEDNRCLRCQIVKESIKHKEEVDYLQEKIYRLQAELATFRSENEALQECVRRERHRRKALQQKLVETNLQHKEECDYMQEDLYHLKTKLAACLSDNEGLQESARQEQYHCMDLQQMLDKANHVCMCLQRKYKEELDQFEKELYRIQKINTQLEQQLSDSERKRERAERTTLTYKSLVSDITDEAEQLDGEVRQLDGEVQQLQSSHKESQRSNKELRETTFRAFCKVRPSLLDLQVVLLQHIPNSREYTDVWLEFLTALNMNHKDIPALVLSECDARWNVQNVLNAWLRGSGSEPKTWGTLLKGMRERGTLFLRELADAAENVYLRKMASLHLPFDVCCMCWKSCSPTIATECSELPVSQSSLCTTLISNV